ncbi:cerebellin-2-like [Myxocyprinus asiaticus]|uniref:cerebellin-2-like n=1 Tax=Myxocyprinus asiaticus TaxID=70543 RepID=UPI002221E28E|nr:cerebellin-2-like [Myxocyprinus asiaticus]
MLLLITLLILNVWAIPAEDVLTPNINILTELGKITSMEKRMKLMENEIEQLREENKAQIKDLKTFYGVTNDTKIKMDELIKQNEASKVAFSASLLTSYGPQSVGPFQDGLYTLIYKHIFLNTGNAYNPNTGIFTAPIRGVYVFTVFSKAFGNREKAVTAGLFKNSQHIISTHAYQQSGFISSSNGVSLLLEVGDKIKVNLYAGQWIFDNGEHHHSTFSGHLLFPM